MNPISGTNPKIYYHDTLLFEVQNIFGGTQCAMLKFLSHLFQIIF